MMSTQSSGLGAHAGSASRDDLRRMLGDIDDVKIIEILALRPSLADLEAAAIWATGDGDVLGKSGRPRAGVVADIVDILAADEDEPPPVR
jgi:hypothetical protein